jgi:hypothetical protein
MVKPPSGATSSPSNGCWTDEPREMELFALWCSLLGPPASQSLMSGFGLRSADWNRGLLGERRLGRPFLVRWPDVAMIRTSE